MLVDRLGGVRGSRRRAGRPTARNAPPPPAGAPASRRSRMSAPRPPSGSGRAGPAAAAGPPRCRSSPPAANVSSSTHGIVISDGPVSHVKPPSRQPRRAPAGRVALLKHGHLAAEPLQAQRDGQAAEPRADHDHLHARRAWSGGRTPACGGIGHSPSFGPGAGPHHCPGGAPAPSLGQTWLTAADCRQAELGDGEEELPALAELCAAHRPKP